MLYDGRILWFDDKSGQGMVRCDGGEYRFSYRAVGGVTFSDGDFVRVHFREFHGSRYVWEVFKGGRNVLETQEEYGFSDRDH